MRSHTSRNNKVTQLPSGNVSTEDNLRTELWDRRYNTREIETLKVVAQQYGLDPLMREVIMLQGNIYVTAAGLQKLAQRDPDYNGCQIEPIVTDWENHFFVMKASVYKKGCDFPFEDFGDADPTTSKLRGKALFRHAITRARARAIRSAFAVPFCALEELDDETRWKAAQQQKHEVSKRPRTKAKAAPVRVQAERLASQTAGDSQPKKVAQASKPLQTKGAANEAASGPREERAETPSQPDVATTHQHTMIERYIEQLGWSEEAVSKLLYETTNSNDFDSLTRLQASHLLDVLAEQIKQNSNKKTIQSKEETAQNNEETGQGNEGTAQSNEETVQGNEVSSESTSVQKELGEPKPVAEVPSGSSQGPNSKEVGLKWTGVEQKRIAEDLLQRMQNAVSLDELRREWQMFQNLRHKLGAEWIEQICETKDQRKSALA